MLVQADWRWGFLCFFALVMVAADLVGLQTGIVDPGIGGVRQAQRGWQDLDLQWENDGPRGQGVYARHADETGALEVIHTDRSAEENRTEPRLAVFTYSPMDINRIDLETLLTLKGVGQKLAAAIIAYRRDHGPFVTIDGLREIKGVGPAKFRSFRSSLVVIESANR